MKKVLLLFVVIVLLGCGKSSEREPSQRLQQPGLQLSYVTPDNWYIGTIPGNNYLMVYTDIDYGVHPNIQIEKVVKKPYLFDTFIHDMENRDKDFSVVSKSIFVTESGIKGEKVEANRLNPDNIPLSNFCYYFTGMDVVYIITAICPKDTEDKYRKIFDEAIQSVQFR